MISGVRDHALALACLRHGVPAAQGRGLDELPPAVTAGFAEALARSVDETELAPGELSGKYGHRNRHFLPAGRQEAPGAFDRPRWGSLPALQAPRFREA